MAGVRTQHILRTVKTVLIVRIVLNVINVSGVKTASFVESVIIWLGRVIVIRMYNIREINMLIL